MTKYSLFLFSPNSTLLVRLVEMENPLNHPIKMVFSYPEPGSNRHGNESTGV